MYLGDLIVEGKLYGSPSPSYGLYQNIINVDKFRTTTQTAITPLDELQLTSGDSRTVMAQANSLVYLRPQEGGMKKVFEAGLSAYEAITKDFKIKFISGLSGKSVKDAFRYTLRPEFKADDHWVAFQDTNSLYIIGRSLTWAKQLIRAQRHIEQAYISTVYHPEPVGLGMLQISKKDKKVSMTMKYPHTQLALGKNVLEMYIPRGDLAVAQMKDIAQYHSAGAAALKVLFDTWNETSPMKADFSKVFSFNDFYAMEAYMEAAYGQMSNIPPPERLYTALDLNEKVLPFLGRPFSLAYPSIVPYNSKLSDEDNTKRISSLLWYNMVSAIVANRAGPRTLPMEYLAVSGNPWRIRDYLPLYTKSPLNFGGGMNQPFWAHPCINRPPKDASGIMFPMAIRDGQDTWFMNTQQDLNLTDMTIDRGEAPLDKLAGEGSITYRTVASRDARIYVIKKWDEEFIVLKIPCVERPEKMKRVTSGLELFLSFLSDPVKGPGYGIGTSADFLEPEANIVAGMKGEVEKVVNGKRMKFSYSAVEATGSEDGKVKTKKTTESSETARTLPGGVGAVDEDIVKTKSGTAKAKARTTGLDKTGDGKAEGDKDSEEEMEEPGAKE